MGWLGTRAGIGVLVAALMLVFAVVPAGLVGYLAGRHSGGPGDHQRFDRRGDGPGWRQDGRQGRQDDRQRGDWRRGDGGAPGPGPRQRQFGPGQRQRVPGVPNQPAPTASPNSSAGASPNASPSA